MNTPDESGRTDRLEEGCWCEDLADEDIRICQACAGRRLPKPAGEELAAVRRWAEEFAAEVEKLRGQEDP